MTRGHTLPRGDIARINRTVTAFEAGEFLPRQTGTQISRPAGDVRAVLLADLDATLPAGDTAPVQAIRLEPARQAWLLRVSSQDNRPFRLGFQGGVTGDLPADISAAQLTEQIQSLTDEAVSVVGRGTSFTDAEWELPTWFIQLGGEIPNNLNFIPNPDPGNWSEARITRTTEFPFDQAIDVHARYAGDALVRAGSVVTCRAAEIGYRIVGATLRPPPPCPAQDARVRVSLFGRPTGGVWSMQLRANATDTEGETFVFGDDLVSLPWNIDAEQFQQAIDQTLYFAGGVSVTGGPAHLGEFELHYHDHLGNQPIPLPLLVWGELEGVVVGAHAYYAQLGRTEPDA
jgi:hypothetical protein